MTWLKYYVKAQVRPGWLLFLVGLAFMNLLLFLETFRRGAERWAFYEVATIVEIYLPIVTALMLAGAPTLEREAGTAELYLSYREPGWLRLLKQLAIPLSLSIAGQIVTLLIAHKWYASVSVGEVLSTALVPTLALGAVALAGSALARHQVGGVLAAGIWWATDLQAAGEFNEWAYLFNTYRPLPQLDAELMRQHQLLVAACALLIALWLSERRPWWVSGTT